MQSPWRAGGAAVLKGVRAGIGAPAFDSVTHIVPALLLAVCLGCMPGRGTAARQPGERGSVEALGSACDSLLLAAGITDQDGGWIVRQSVALHDGTVVRWPSRASPLGVWIAMPPPLDSVPALKRFVVARDGALSWSGATSPVQPAGGTISISTRNVRVSGTHRYSPDGTAVPPGDYVMLRITETGVGMGAETQAHIFEPFFTTKEPERGTGLGLATVYRIVKRAQGHVLVQSELGRGTTFDVLGPRVAGPVETTLRAAPELTARSSRGEIILLVEDDPSVREGVCRLLTRQGHTVVEARSGAEALRKAEAEGLEIDLVISDMVMPEMNGPELVRRLRGRSPGIRVLLMSGYSREMVDTLPTGPRDACIEKPFTAA